MLLNLNKFISSIFLKDSSYSLCICIFLLIAVIYFSVKPISMGIEARRNIKNNGAEESFINEDVSDSEINFKNKTQISEEIIKLKKLKDEGLITEVEFEKAKDKLLS